MQKSTKILVPVDFSPSSENAFRFALQFADKTGASIYLLNVVAPQAEGLDYPVMVANATQQRLEAARELKNKFIDAGIAATKEYLKEAPSISSDLEIGMPISGIVNVAKREDIDLIIIGSRGENRSFTEKILGSVTSGVVGSSNCSVMVIPEDSTLKTIDSMCYSTEVSHHDPFEIWKALGFLKPFSPKIDVVHINLKKEGNLEAWNKLEQLKLFFEEKDSKMDMKLYNLPGENIQKELNEFIEKESSDLLVMYQPNHNLWDRLFFKSTTKNMAMHTKVPLLILKND